MEHSLTQKVLMPLVISTALASTGCNKQSLSAEEQLLYNPSSISQTITNFTQAYTFYTNQAYTLFEKAKKNNQLVIADQQSLHTSFSNAHRITLLAQTYATTGVLESIQAPLQWRAQESNLLYHLHANLYELDVGTPELEKYFTRQGINIKVEKKFSKAEEDGLQSLVDILGSLADAIAE